MKTNKVVEKIENLVGRKLNSEEVYAIRYINDEGWEDVGPVMREVLGLIEEATKKV